MPCAGRGAAGSQPSSQGPRQFPIRCLGCSPRGPLRLCGQVPCARGPLSGACIPGGSRLAPVRAALRRRPAASSQRRLGPGQLQAAAAHFHMPPVVAILARPDAGSGVNASLSLHPQGHAFLPSQCQPSPWWRLCWSSEPAAVAGGGLGKLARARQCFQSISSTWSPEVSRYWPGLSRADSWFPIALG